MKDHTLSRILVFFVAIFAVIGGVAFFAVRNINRSAASTDWVNHTYAVIFEVDNILSSVLRGDGAMRTFVLSNDPRDLAASRQAFAELTEHCDTAKALTRSDAPSHEAVLQLETLTRERQALATSVWDARRDNQPERVQSLLAADAASTTLDEIKRAVGKLRDEQFTLLSARERVAYRQAETTRWIVGTGVGLNLLLLGAVAWLIRDDLNARRSLAASLQQTNEQLDAKVRERTAELSSANEKLTAENLERDWANQALEHQLRYDRLIVDSIADLVLILTKTLKISRVNPAVVRATGLEPPALINRPLSDIVRLTADDERMRAPLTDPLLHALKSGHDLRDARAIVKDRRGGKITVRLTLCPLRDGNKVVGGVMILQPVPNA